MESFNVSRRVIFDDEQDIMEVDFSDLNFSTSADVDEVYDAIDAQIAKTQRKWYFLVNYRNTQIFPDAWFQYALRGKNINIARSLGSVRYDPREPTRQEILKRAKEEDFNPNLVFSREEAMQRIAELKQHSANKR